MSLVKGSARLLGAAGIAGVLAVAMSNPAAAAGPWYAYTGSDYGVVAADDRYVGACDMEQDGNGVYGMFYYGDGSLQKKVGDGNGSAAGCGNWTAPSRIIGFKICEDDAGADTCSAIKATE
jgi:hypothetical protein